MGNSGSAYDIRVDERRVFCSCPDHASRGNLCKHLMFVLIRACKMPQQDIFRDYYSVNRFNSTEETLTKCQEFFQRREEGLEGERFRPDPVDTKSAKEVAVRPTVERKEIDDCCPICYEDFADTQNENTVWCRYGCGKSLHENCFLRWSQSQSMKRQTVNCVYCRTQWDYIKK